MSEIIKHNWFALPETFKQSLYAEDTSKNTTSVYVSDLSHFLNWYSQTFDCPSLEGVLLTLVHNFHCVFHT